MVTMPVTRDFKVTSPFGPRWGTTHWGTDFGNGKSGNHPVFAVKDGTVTRAGPASGFGRWVTIDHPASNGGGETIYGHVIPEVKAGQRVREGQRIARINPDKATNGGVVPHLHMEWHRYSWVPPGPGRLDPMVMLKGAKWPGETGPPGVPEVPGSNVTVTKKGEPMSDKGYDIDLHHLIGFGRKTSLPKKVIIVHTTENSPGTSSRAILDYQVRTRSGSYHRLVDSTGKITLANTDDWQVWATGNKGNDIALHVSLVARARMTRAEWLAQPKMLEGCARVIAYWARTYNIPLRKLSREELGRGAHGVAGHLEAQVWGNTDHWDPGYSFPYDVVLKRAGEINNPPKPAPKPDAKPVTPKPEPKPDAGEPLGVYTADLILDQLVGPRDTDGTQHFRGWEQLGGRTIVDALALIGEKLEIDGFSPPARVPDPPRK